MSRADLIFICAGALLFLLGVACALVATRKEDRALVIADTPTSNARDLETTFRRDGAYGQPCELVGLAECDAPLAGPLTGQSCVAYRHALTWEAWRKARPFDRRAGVDGLVCHDRGTEFDERAVPSFWLRDATGRILVEPANVELDLKEIDQRYEVVTASFGGSERRTRRAEHALPLGQPVYLLGYLGERDGAPVLRRHPTDPKRKFLVSYRSEQQLLRANRAQSYGFYFAAGIAGSLGIVLVLWRVLI